MNGLKIAATLAGFYGASLLLTGVALFGAMALTTGMGAGRTSELVMGMLALDAGIFFLCTVGVFLVLGRFTPRLGLRILLVLSYGVASLLALGMLGFMSALIFNR